MYVASQCGLSARLTGKRVLVVEDEALVSMLIEDELREAGAEVIGPVPSLDDAIWLTEAAAADGGISAAVLDINLNGQQVDPVADRLAALGVPFLFVTGYDESHELHAHRTAPVVRKPFDPGKLIEAVTSLATARVSA